MTRVRRFDSGTLASPQRLDNGYMRCDARITRTGVFTYQLADGTRRRELRLPDEVFHPDSLHSFTDVALTNDHPSEPLTAKNTRKYQVGHISHVRADEQFVAARLMITDDEAISEAEKGKRDLSCGYTCDLDPTPGVTKSISGVPDGIKYDAIQKNIRGNHVAIVARGRAGPEVSLKLDEDDAVQVPREDNQGAGQPSGPEGKRKMHKIKIDGVDFEMTEQAAQAVAKVMTKADEAEAAFKEHKEAASKEKARADKAEEDLKATKAKLEERKDESEIREAVKARVSLVTTAGKILGDKTEDGKAWAFDDMSDEEIKRACVVKVSPGAKEKLDGCDAVYLQARFDAAIEAHKEDKKKPSAAVNTMRHVGGSEDRMDAEAARKRMVERHQNLWRADREEEK